MQHLKMRWLIICVLVVCVEYVSAQNTCEQPDVAGIVVGTVFGTLAVVALVLGIIAFLLWRRNKLFKSTPKKARKVNSTGLHEDRASPDREGHVNPAFNEPDISAAEAGFGGYVPCGEYVPNKDNKKSPVSKDDKRKTWTSLPQSDIPEVLHRHGSCGSLDDNYLTNMMSYEGIDLDPEVISVCLQSQDFIGLGFNISGNMRDGIYVSTVHNRGPAIESGKVKVGDRIKSVTISFDNMVYEDALTILSYASPYPVKVTLQKEKVVVTDRRTSDTNDNLSHPLYRSQSLDALQRIGREPLFKPKRTLSEMKPETRNSSGRAEKLEEIGHQAAMDVIEGVESQSSTLESKKEKVVDFSPPEGQVNVTVSDVLVHKSDNSQQQKSETFTGIDIPDFGKPEEMMSEQIERVTESAPPAAATESSSAALEFANLMDQMLDLKDSQEPKKESKKPANIDVHVGNGTINDVTAAVASELNTTPKTPTKPQRKKRNSSTTSPTSTLSSAMSPDSLINQISPDSLMKQDFSFEVNSPVKSEIIVEDMIQAVSSKVVESIPNRYADKEEIQEDEIVPEKAKKEIHFGSDQIEFTQKEQQSRSERAPSPVLNGEALGLSMSTSYKTREPEGDPIEEELIQAEVAKKDSSAPPPQIIKDEIVVAVQSSVTQAAAPPPREAAPAKKEKSPKKAPELNEEMLEQIISMNANPPGTTALPWMNNNDLDAFEVPEKDRPTSPKGIAFEIRDDITTGLPRAVDLNKSNVMRTMSYDLRLSDKKDPEVRSSGQLRDDQSRVPANRQDSLDWSGKRLVRSGSFTDIPHNASASDWTDKNVFEDGSVPVKVDDLSDSDSESVMKRATDIFAPRENLANISDLSDVNLSFSPSSAENGQDISITSTELQLKNNNIEGLPSFEKSFGGVISSDKKASYSINLSMDTHEDEDVEC